ncbi:MAG: hypothetical protein J6R22_02765 [Alphaproteobacteria bacterium]|nr:hypothetical protein [Alphaproteobacteria bacterium]
MKTKTFIFSSLLILCGAIPARSSDCAGEGCYVKPLVFEEFEEQVVEVEQPAQPVQTVEVEYVEEVPMRSVKLLSIKPVPEDTRPALWDGVHGKYTGHSADKTVDWRDGVPIWDDSIASYKYKDFSDWFLEDSPELYIREIDVHTNPIELYQQNMQDAAATRARVEELLMPQKPANNIWFGNVPAPEYVAQDMTEIVVETFGDTGDGCPFETETECEIWRRKPIVRETLSPRSPKLRNANVAAFVNAADCNHHITANEAVSAPLLERYKMLMRSAQACCTDGMVYALKQAGASEGLIYKFMSDDANFYGFGSRCLMMTDYDLDTKYPNTATAVVAADVRNGCLCRGRQWFQAMLAPFQQVYQELPEFKNAQFNYTYKDGLQREITVSVNNDVQNVLKQLAQCP